MIPAVRWSPRPGRTVKLGSPRGSPHSEPTQVTRITVRTKDGHCYLVETKGREDKDVTRKARAALAWCEAASKQKCPWEYIYVPQGVFERLTGHTVAELARTCQPALKT